MIALVPLAACFLTIGDGRMNFTHIANPVRVAAKQLGPVEIEGAGAVSRNADGSVTHMSAEMLARYFPVEGDYFVTQEDGYVYVNPKDVFERKYSPIAE